jgi:uncharacterized protein (TIGR02246 family)
MSQRKTDTMTNHAIKIADNLIDDLEQAWNNADGKAFGKHFTATAYFVDIRGELHQSKKTIAAGHQEIFDSLYKDSRIQYTLIQARKVGKGVILAHIAGELTAPSGQHKSLQSLVLVRRHSGWKISSFHNTLVAPQP